MVESMNDQEVELVLTHFGSASFTTFEFICELKQYLPETWARLEAAYGPGGKGAGKHYSVYSRVSHALNGWAGRGLLEKNDYEPSPPGWGSPVIRRWNGPGPRRKPILAAGTDGSETHIEGVPIQVFVTRYERDPAARRKCIEHYKPICQVCDFDFEKTYGPLGAGFIHVHHRVPISTIGKSYSVDPIEHLVPVCPNCHTMLHHSKTLLTVEELRGLVNRLAK